MNRSDQGAALSQISGVALSQWSRHRMRMERMPNTPQSGKRTATGRYSNDRPINKISRQLISRGWQRETFPPVHKGSRYTKSNVCYVSMRHSHGLSAPHVSHTASQIPSAANYMGNRCRCISERHLTSQIYPLHQLPEVCFQPKPGVTPVKQVC